MKLRADTRKRHYAVTVERWYRGEKQTFDCLVNACSVIRACELAIARYSADSDGEVDHAEVVSVERRARRDVIEDPDTGHHVEREMLGAGTPAYMAPEQLSCRHKWAGGFSEAGSACRLCGMPLEVEPILKRWSDTDREPERDA